MFIRGGLTRAQARQQRKELLAEIEREQRRKDRETLAELRKQIREANARRKDAMRAAVDRCKTDRQSVRE